MNSEIKTSVGKLRKIRQLLLWSAIGIFLFGWGYTMGNDRSLDWLLRNKGLPLISATAPENGGSVSKASAQVDGQADMNLYWKIWNQLHSQYLDKSKLETQKMVYGAIKGMVASIGDPYTVFLTPEENKRSMEDLQGAFSGVGIQLGYKDDPTTTYEEKALAVISPLEGQPAEKVGVKAGDWILKIDETSTHGMSIPEAVDLIRGEEGSSVKLTLLSNINEEPHDVTIVRSVINVPSVHLSWQSDAGKKVAHLRVSRFGEQTGTELTAASGEILTSWENNQMKGVVLDLRGNPGGYFNQAIGMISMFVKSGVAVQQEDGTGHKEQFKVDGNAVFADIPLVVLIDQGSASSSEITAGALRELRSDVKLVGKKSFGKGVVQQAENLADGSGIHITTDRWLLPSGGNIDKQGVSPDIDVDYVQATGSANLSIDERMDSQLQKAIEVL